MQQLIYCSTAKNPLEFSVVKSIIQVAEKNNKDNNLTGVLFFSTKFFMQCLEGSREEVNKIYEKICRDERHHKFLIMDYRYIVKRDFPNWGMGVANFKKVNQEHYASYGLSTFDPYVIEPLAARGFLKDLYDQSNIFTGDLENL